jgi:cytoskeletal protein RodZ
MPSLGQELRTKREERGSSLKDISVHTKIGTRLLQALEDDRLDLLPEPFFLKGVLRSYVRAIGADESYFLQRLAEVMDTSAAPEAPPPKIVPSPRRRTWFRIAAGLMVVMAAAAALYFVFKTRPAPAPVIKSPLRESSAAPASEPSPAAVRTPPPAASEAALKLEMSFQAETWILITADGVKVSEGVQPPGGTAEFKAEKELILQIGNAGGFTFKLNGKPGKPLGPSGAVRTDVRITPETLAAFLDQPGGGSAGR